MALFPPNSPGSPADFRLARLFGIHYTGSKSAAVTCLAPVRDDLLPGVTAEYPVMLDSAQLLVRAEEDAKCCAL